MKFHNGDFFAKPISFSEVFDLQVVSSYDHAEVKHIDPSKIQQALEEQSKPCEEIFSKEQAFKNELDKIRDLNQRDAVELAHKKAIEIVQLADSRNWTLIKDKEGTKACTMSSPDGFKIVKGEGWIQGDINQAS